MSVSGLAPVGGAIGGFVVGFLAVLILFIPTCFAVGVANMNSSLASVESITERILTPVPFIGAVIGLVVGLARDISEAKAETERKRREAAAQRDRIESERRQYIAQQMQFRGIIANLNEESLSAFEQLPLQLRSAEEHLDKAERDFARGAFVPFWESIEKAAFALGGFEERVRTIERNSSQYVDAVERARKYEVKSPAFSVSSNCVPKLRIASETSKRMSEVVDKAQCNFQFSQTYLQIKTNQILVAGFKNLAHALEEMTWRITSSIDDLSTSVNSMGAKLDDSLRRLHVQGERIANATEKLRSEVAGSSAREQKALEMLDNIQRKRYPSIIHGGLR